jgi:hypothetical protein
MLVDCAFATVAIPASRPRLNTADLAKMDMGFSEVSECEENDTLGGVYVLKDKMLQMNF